jgi:hypothetical protein
MTGPSARRELWHAEPLRDVLYPPRYCSHLEIPTLAKGHLQTSNCDASPPGLSRR